MGDSEHDYETVSRKSAKKPKEPKQKTQKRKAVIFGIVGTAGFIIGLLLGLLIGYFVLTCSVGKGGGGSGKYRLDCFQFQHYIDIIKPLPVHLYPIHDTCIFVSFGGASNKIYNCTDGNDCIEVCIHKILQQFSICLPSLSSAFT